MPNGPYALFAASLEHIRKSSDYVSGYFLKNLKVVKLMEMIDRIKTDPNPEKQHAQYHVGSDSQPPSSQSQQQVWNLLDQVQK